MRKVAMMAIALTFLTACEPNEMYPVPLGAGAGSGGNAGSYPANPPNSPILAKPITPIEPSPVVQETHGAVSRQNCYDMEAKFLREGRRITLVRVERSTNPGATLQYTCIFEGEDADQGYFEDKRY